MNNNSFVKDITGAFGDTGIFIPLALGMIVICKLSPTAVFFPAAILYIIAGLYYKIPVPVQPLKAVAAIALANAVSPDLIATSAYLMSVLMLIFIFFDFAKFLDKIFSKPIVRGIQLGLGLLLIKSGIRLILKGEVIKGIMLPAVTFKGFDLGPTTVSFFLPSLESIWSAFFILLLPQIPLTFGNSIVATRDVAKSYFGKRAKKVTYKNLAATIASGNILAGLFSGMPVCHGSGGLTAHYRFGARTSRSNIIIGCTFLVLALLLAKISPYLLQEIPLYFFGTALIFIGVFHALLAKDIGNKNDLLVVASMGLATVLFTNLTIALLIGLAFRMLRQVDKVFYKHKPVSIHVQSQSFLNNSNNGLTLAPYQPPLLDKYNRGITQLRIAVTDECNFKYPHGLPSITSEATLTNHILSCDEVFRLSKIAVQLGIKKIRLTGGEPLLRNDIVSITKRIASLADLQELSLSTNGLLLSRYAHELKQAGLKKVSISLDTLNPDKFRYFSGGKELDSVVAAIEHSKKTGFEQIKVNVVVLRGINDDELEDFIDFSKKYDIMVRLIEYMPVVLNTEWRQYFISREEIMQRVSSFFNTKVYPFVKQNDPTKYFYLNTGGETGLISPVSHGLCQTCNRLKLTANGFLRNCLIRDYAIDVRTPLRQYVSDETIENLFKKAVIYKPTQLTCALRKASIRQQ